MLVKSNFNQCIYTIISITYILTHERNGSASEMLSHRLTSKKVWLVEEKKLIDGKDQKYPLEILFTLHYIISQRRLHLK